MNVPVADPEFGLPGTYLFPEGTSFKARADEMRKFFFESGMVDLLRQEYAKHNLYWLDLHPASESLILCTKEVHTLDDVKGLKVNELTQGLTAVWLKEVGWGAVPGLPPSEVYLALKLGTIDATVFDTSAMTNMLWHEVAPYWLTNIQYCDTSIMNMLVNMDSWNALPDDLKKVVTDGAEVYYEGNNDAYVENIARFQQMITDGEVIINRMDDEYMQQALEAAHKTWEEVAETDPACAKAIELWKKWRGIE